MATLNDSSGCKFCKLKVIGFPTQYCRRSLINQDEIRNLRGIESGSGQVEVDRFIRETRLKAKYCDDFIEWIPNSKIKKKSFLTEGGMSKIFLGEWSPVLNKFSIDVILKEIKDSKTFNWKVLNEFEMHYRCRGLNVIPFYGITKSLVTGEYTMIIKRAKYGDLRSYIKTFFPKLTLTDKIKMLIGISKALNSLHETNILHRDFHCKNILVDDKNKVYIVDFGLCVSADTEIVTNEIEGVLPYIAPEVFRQKPYTKKSEVYSLSMIMWELTSGKPPFVENNHDIDLTLSILNGKRPEVIEGTPEFYSKIMKQCWDDNPENRIPPSCLPKIFEEMLELCEYTEIKIEPMSFVIKPIKGKETEPIYRTEQYDLTLDLLSGEESKISGPPPPPPPQQQYTPLQPPSLPSYGSEPRPKPGSVLSPLPGSTPPPPPPLPNSAPPPPPGIILPPPQCKLLQQQHSAPSLPSYTPGSTPPPLPGSASPPPSQSGSILPPSQYKPHFVSPLPSYSQQHQTPINFKTNEDKKYATQKYNFTLQDLLIKQK